MSTEGQAARLRLERNRQLQRVRYPPPNNNGTNADPDLFVDSADDTANEDTSESEDEQWLPCVVYNVDGTVVRWTGYIYNFLDAPASAEHMMSVEEASTQAAGDDTREEGSVEDEGSEDEGINNQEVISIASSSSEEERGAVPPSGMDTINIPSTASGVSHSEI